MARGYSQAKSEESREMRRQGQALIDKAQAIEAKEMADKVIAKEAKARNLEPGRDPMRALNQTAALLTAGPSEEDKNIRGGYDAERFNRRKADAEARLMKVKDILEASKNNKEFFEKLGEAKEMTIEGNYSVEKGLLYNGNLGGKERAEQFLESVKEGLKEGSFGDAFRQAKVTFKGSRKDEVRIDFPAGTELPRRSDLRSAIRSLGTAMTYTQTEQYGDGFGHTPMPKVTFRVGGEEVDSIDYM
jgi:hypothetical protein